MNKLICTGLACPQPVLITRKYLEENPAAGSVTVVVDNRAAAENIVRFLENSGFTAGITNIENGFEIEGSRIKGDEVQCGRYEPSEAKKPLS